MATQLKAQQADIDNQLEARTMPDNSDAFQDIFTLVLMEFLTPMDRIMFIPAHTATAPINASIEARLEEKRMRGEDVIVPWRAWQMALSHGLGKTKDQYWCCQVAHIILHPRKDVNDYILDVNVEKDCPEKVFTTPLHIAARAGDAEACKRLISEKAKVNANLKLRDQPEPEAEKAARRKKRFASAPPAVGLRPSTPPGIDAVKKDVPLLDSGMITPLRMAMTFNAPDDRVIKVLQDAGGKQGSGHFDEEGIKLRSLLVGEDGKVEKQTTNLIYRKPNMQRSCKTVDK